MGPVIVIGIDPALMGAVAAIGHHGELLDVRGTPTIKLKRGSRRYAVAEMRELLRSLVRAHAGSPEDVHVALEFVATNQQNLGLRFGAGLWEGLVGGLELRYEIVPEERWRTGFGLSEGKGESVGKEVVCPSILVARRLWPGDSRISEDHHLADAVLIAEWVRLAIQGGEPTKLLPYVSL